VEGETMHLNTNPAYIVGCDCTVGTDESNGSNGRPHWLDGPSVLTSAVYIDRIARPSQQDGCRDPTKCRCAAHMDGSFA